LDSGLHQVLARRYYTVLSARGIIIPTDLQSMGFAIPTAIGARMGAPNRAVVALVGDGGFAMMGLELLTAARERISLVVIVFVDGVFGQIRMQQLASYGVGHGVSFQNPDFKLIAAAVGASYEFVGDNDIEAVVRAALDRSGITVIEVSVGDTPAIRRHAAFARSRQVTRLVTGPRVFHLLTRVFMKVSRAVGF
jgi:acetolactate synthase I/II/III large subunit